MKRIAIQGELGSFHDITAHQYFEGEQIETNTADMLLNV